jgi:hypothetical protein
MQRCLCRILLAERSRSLQWLTVAVLAGPRRQQHGTARVSTGHLAPPRLESDLVHTYPCDTSPNRSVSPQGGPSYSPCPVERKKTWQRQGLSGPRGCRRVEVRVH